MKILLDENIPLKFRYDLSTHEVYTVYYQKWLGVKNGELLVKMLEEGFEILISFDQHIEAQQNFEKYPIPVLVLKAQNNSYQTLQKYVKEILEYLNTNLKAGANILILE